MDEDLFLKLLRAEHVHHGNCATETEHALKGLSEINFNIWVRGSSHSIGMHDGGRL
jgi:hypothetical protein